MAEAESEHRHALPPNNPFLVQNSAYPSVHFDSAQTDTTTLPTWPGKSTLEPSQVDWLPGLTTIGTVHRPYPGGEQAVFFSGGNRVGKIRITGGDFSMVDEVSIPGLEDNTISTTKLRRIVKQMESAKGDETVYLPPLTEFLEITAQSSATLMNGLYTLMDSDGYYYAGWGPQSTRLPMCAMATSIPRSRSSSHTTSAMGCPRTSETKSVESSDSR